MLLGIAIIVAVSVSSMRPCSSAGHPCVSSLNHEVVIFEQNAIVISGSPARVTIGGNRGTALFFFCPSGDDSVRFVEQAVVSARAAGWAANELVVLDTSYAGQAQTSRFLQGNTGLIYQTTPTGLTFSMLQNVAMELATQSGLQFYFWQHADVVIVSDDKDTFASQAFEHAKRAPNDWGVLFFAYDWFAAFKTRAVRKVPWDQGINHYFSDCDFYHRTRLAGYATYDRNAGFVMHKKTPLAKGEAPQGLEVLNLTVAWYKQRGAYSIGEPKPSVPGERRGVVDSNAAGISRYKAEQQAAYSYAKQKWGTLNCSLTNQMPNFDIVGPNDGNRIL